jgi:hypothetical protein
VCIPVKATNAKMAMSNPPSMNGCIRKPMSPCLPLEHNVGQGANISPFNPFATILDGATPQVQSMIVVSARSETQICYRL